MDAFNYRRLTMNIENMDPYSLSVCMARSLFKYRSNFTQGYERVLTMLIMHHLQY